MSAERHARLCLEETDDGLIVDFNGSIADALNMFVNFVAGTADTESDFDRIISKLFVYALEIKPRLNEIRNSQHDIEGDAEYGKDCSCGIRNELN